MSTREELDEIRAQMGELQQEERRLERRLLGELQGEAARLRRAHRAAGTDPTMDEAYRAAARRPCWRRRSPPA